MVKLLDEHPVEVGHLVSPVDQRDVGQVFLGDRHRVLATPGQDESVCVQDEEALRHSSWSDASGAEDEAPCLRRVAPLVLLAALKSELCGEGGEEVGGAAVLVAALPPVHHGHPDHHPHLHVALRQRLLVQLDYLLHRCFVLGRNDSQRLVLLDRVLGALGGVPDDDDDDDDDGDDDGDDDDNK